VLCTDIVHRFSQQLLDCFSCLSLYKTLCVPHIQRSYAPTGTVFSCQAFSLGTGGQHHLISAVSSITTSFMVRMPCTCSALRAQRYPAR